MIGRASRALLVWATLALACAPAREEAAAPRPNVVLVLADDQRYDTLGCTGNALVETPSIDRLAREGVLFARAYVVTSLCCPARATLLTGRYPHESGIRDNTPLGHGPFLAGGAGFPERLQAAGYETAFVGKWHIENPGASPQPGFDRWVSFEGQGRYEGETLNVDGARAPIDAFNTDALADHAVEFLERPRERPFCLILSLKNLHGPYLPPERHRRKLLQAEFPLPASAADPEESLPAYVRHARTTPRNAPLAHGGATRTDFVRGYHQLVFSLDEAVGRVLEALDRLGLAESTLVIHTSDGGFLWGEHGLYRKRAAYEPSIHVPLVARWPAGLPSGAVVERLVTNADIAPTLLALAGASAPADLPGENLMLSLDPAAPWREDFLYVDGWTPGADGPYELALVGERTKYVRYRWGAVEELLLERASDPDERRNLARDPAQRDALGRARARLVALLAENRLPASWMDARAAVEDEGVDED